MTFTLSRNSFYVIGLIIISFYYLLNKFEFIRKSSFASGNATSDQEIQFSLNKKAIVFNSIQYLNFKYGEKVKVIYLTANPNKAYVFSFLGFWYEGLLITLIPLVLWSALVFSFFEQEDKLVWNLFGKKKSIKVHFQRKRLEDKKN